MPLNSTGSFSCPNLSLRIDDDAFKSHKELIMQSIWTNTNHPEVWATTTTTVDSFEPAPASWARTLIIIGIVMGVIALIWIIAIVMRNKQVKRQQQAQSGNVQDGLLDRIYGTYP